MGQKAKKTASHSGRSRSWQKTPTLTLDDFQAFFGAIAPSRAAPTLPSGGSALPISRCPRVYLLNLSNESIEAFRFDRQAIYLNWFGDQTAKLVTTPSAIAVCRSALP
ncbi:hypothetical protein [Thermoleptolyngbya sp.]